jgi:hypothetical protein
MKIQASNNRLASKTTLSSGASFILRTLSIAHLPSAFSEKKEAGE